MPSVLYVSKPVAPPWNDSSKNLVRDLALALAPDTGWKLSSIYQHGYRLEKTAVN